MKPDWSKAPDWANWAAQEPSSAWYWYSERPTYSEICTEWQTKGRREIIPRVDVRPQATLEERPISPLMIPPVPKQQYRGIFQTIWTNPNVQQE